MGEPPAAHRVVVALVVTLARLLDPTVASAPGRAALVDGERACTYGELNDLADDATPSLRDTDMLAQVRSA